MLSLELIKELPKSKWALTPWLNNPPTIAEYNRRPSVYTPHIIKSGVYSIVANDDSMYHSWGDMILINDPDWWAWHKFGKQGNNPWKSDVRTKVFLSNSTWIESIRKGTISFSGDTVKFIGVFEKNGSVIGLNTLHPEAIACV